MPQETEIFRGEGGKEIESIKQEIYEKAGERNRGEVMKLVEEVGAILDEEKRRGTGQLRGTIPGILESEYGDKYFVDESVVYLPPRGEVIIVGDIHGDPGSIISVLEQNRFIEEMEGGNKELKIVFLGDYVDRGRRSRAAIELVLDLKKRYPNNVVLLRGNHEEIGQSMTGYTFGKELYGSFGQSSGDSPGATGERITAVKIFFAFHQFFTKLPSVLVVGNGLIAVHGGIPSQEIGSLQELSKDEEILADVRFLDPDENISGIEDSKKKTWRKSFWQRCFF
jgi:hypothetical protein